jgi:hypothetical protein
VWSTIINLALELFRFMSYVGAPGVTRLNVSTDTVFSAFSGFQRRRVQLQATCYKLKLGFSVQDGTSGQRSKQRARTANRGDAAADRGHGNWEAAARVTHRVLGDGHGS